MIRRVAVVFLFLWLVPSVALANVTRKFCAVYTVAYTDAAAGIHLTDSTVTARGAKFRLHNNSSGVNTDMIAAVTGADAGCVSVNLDNSAGVTYDVKLYAHAEVDGNTAKVTDSSHVTASILLQGSYNPNSGDPATYTPGPGAIIHIIAAATYGMLNGTGSVTGEVFEFHANAGISYYHSSTQEIDIGQYQDVYKFLILHEMGHAVFDAATGYAGVAASYWAAEDCSAAYGNGSHWIDSKEYQSAAAWEGVADFYAAHVLNDHATYDADCTFYIWYPVDWDLDGTTGDLQEFSCEDGIDDYSIPSLDFLGTYCIATGYSANRATHYDWLRMWWDMRTDQDLTLADVQELWVLAEPVDWAAFGADTADTGGKNPAHRFSDAALTFGGAGFQDDWEEIAFDEGVYR